MAEIATGHVTDRPFARTVYTIAAKRFTGDLVLTSSGREYKVSWEDGQVTAADSSSPSDRPVRVAMTSGLIDKTLVAQVLQVQMQQKKRDPMDIIGEVGRLSAEQMSWLKRRTLAMHAARQFALGDATYSLRDNRSMVADPDVPAIDPRWLIYFGVVTYYSFTRLESEVGSIMNASVQISPDAIGSLPAFGFGPTEQPCIERLEAQPISVPDLIRASPELDRHKVLSVLYTLVACDCLNVQSGTARAPSSQPRAQSAVPQPSPVQHAEGSQPMPRANPAGSRSIPTRPPSRPPPVSRPATGSNAPPSRQPRNRFDTRQRERAQVTRQQLRQTAQGRDATHAVKLGSKFTGGKGITANEVGDLVARKVKQMDSGADYFALLGVQRSAMTREIHDAYFHLAKRLHPDRIRAVGLEDMVKDAQRLFAKINQAFATLTNSAKLSEYRKTLAAGGEVAMRRKQADAEQRAAAIFAAEDHFRQGELALRRNAYAEALGQFQKALELNPDEGEHHAYTAWALWCSSYDKTSIGPKLNELMKAATKLSPNSSAVFYYKAMLAKQHGDVKAAKKAFQKVLDIDPEHRQAEAELRLLLSQGDKKGGLFR